MSWMSALRGFAACLAISFFLAACGGGSDVQTTVSGRVMLDKPVVGATVALAGDGAPLQGASATTDASGYFSITVRGPLPSQLQVTSQGGQHDGRPVGAVLRADYGDLRPHAVLFVNVLTTLAADVRALRPDLSAAQSADAVRAFLKLGMTMDLGADFNGINQAVFSHTRYLGEAEAAGGLDPFTRQIAADIAAGRPSAYSFNTVVLRGALDGVVSALAGKIALSAVGDVANSGFLGSFMATVFGDPNSANYQKLNQILQQLGGLQTQTTAIAQTLTSVDQRVSDLTTDVNTLTQEVRTLSSQVAALDFQTSAASALNLYTGIATQTNDPVAAIKSAYFSYQQVVGQAASGNTSTLAADELAARALDPLSGVYKQLVNINDNLLGSSSMGAIEAWHRLTGFRYSVATQVPGYYYPYLVPSSFIDRLNDQFEYYQAIQLQGLLVLMEAYNYRGLPDQARSVYDAVTANLAAQRNKLYSGRVTPNVFISPIKGGMWNRQWLYDGYCFSYGGGGTGCPIITSADQALPFTDYDQPLIAHFDYGYSGWRGPSVSELYVGSELVITVERLRGIGFYQFDGPLSIILADGVLNSDDTIAARAGWWMATPTVRSFNLDPYAADYLRFK